MCCSDNASAQRKQRAAAYAFKNAVLQRPEQPSLQSDFEFADFVEEEGSAPRSFEFSDMALEGTRKRSTFVAKEFTLDQAGCEAAQSTVSNG